MASFYSNRPLASKRKTNPLLKFPNQAWIQFTIRNRLSGVLVVGVSEIAKKNELFGALVASLPLLSIAALLWLYHDTGDTEKVAIFSQDIFWLVLPSLLFFVSLPLLLRKGVQFWPSFCIALTLTVVAYWVGLRLFSGEEAWL